LALTVNNVVDALKSAQRIRFFKNLTAPKAAGSFQSGWLATGTPGTGVTPPTYTAGSGYTCDDTTVGAPTYNNAVGFNRLARASATSSQAGSVIIYDRLWHCSGMGFANATYTVTTPGNLPARITDNGVGTELWVEQNVAAGAASGTLTANYLNAATGASKSGVIPAVVSAPVIGQLQQVPFAVGDTGIRQLTSVTTSATWTSGSFGMTIMKPLIELPLDSIGVGKVFDWAMSALDLVPADACLMIVLHANNATAPIIRARIDIGDFTE
jgi:hypothetical protein